MTLERAKELCRTIAQDWYDADESLLALTDRIVAVVLRACREQKEADVTIASNTVCATHLSTGIKIYGNMAAKAIGRSKT